MDTIKIKGYSRELGRSQGFVPLCVRDGFTHDAGTGKDYLCMEAAFKPTREELQKLLLGEPIVLRILGTDWPPVDIGVGDNITDVELAQLKEYHRKARASAIIESLKHRPVSK